MEFVSWQSLATYAGSLAMVIAITEFSKNIGVMKKVPTQIISYVIALIVLYLANFFTGQLNGENAVLIIFNSVIVALAANGGFDALKRAFPSLFEKLKK